MKEGSEDSEFADAGDDAGPATSLLRTRIVTALLFSGVAVIGILAAVAHRSNIRATEEARRADAAAGRVHSVVTWEGQAFQSGDRVRIVRWAGTFKPRDTGFSAEIEAEPGRIGIVLAGERRISSDHMTIDPAEPIQIVRVRWDAQRWRVVGRTESVELKGFEATIHVSYLEIIR